MKYPLLLLVLSLALAGCSAPPPSQAVDPSPEAPITSAPEGTNFPAADQGTAPSPEPTGEGLSRGNVYITSVELLIRESFPPQIALQVSGDLPTPCHALKAEVSEPNPENTILVTIYSVYDSKKACIQVLKPFTENVSIGTFPNGHYTVVVNGKTVGEFDS